MSELYTEGSFPVGLIPEAEYTSARLQLEPEDTLVLFSDGVTEAENPDHELFEVSGLSQALAGQKDVPVEELQQSILDCGARLYARAPASRTTLRCWWCATGRRRKARAQSRPSMRPILPARMNNILRAEAG